jgi:hypothetical protein
MTVLLLHAGLAALAAGIVAVVGWGVGTALLARGDARRPVTCPRCGPERCDGGLGDVSAITGQLERVRGPALPLALRRARGHALP